MADPMSLRPPIRWAKDRRKGDRACAWPGRRAIATRRIVTGSRRSELNGCKINALDLAGRGQKPVGQLASAFPGLLVAPRPSKRPILIRDAQPISSIFRCCCFPAVGRPRLVAWLVYPDGAASILAEGRTPAPAPTAPVDSADWIRLPSQIDAYLDNTISAFVRLCSACIGNPPSRCSVATRS